MVKQEISGFEYIVNLCSLAKMTKDITTSEHFRHFFGTIKDVYKEERCILNSLRAGLEFDASVTLARETYLLSKVYRNIPNKVPDYITNTSIGTSAEALSRI